MYPQKETENKLSGAITGHIRKKKNFFNSWNLMNEGFINWSKEWREKEEEENKNKLLSNTTRIPIWKGKLVLSIMAQKTVMTPFSVTESWEIW